VTLLRSSGSVTNDIVPLVHSAEEDVAEMNGPNAVVDFLKADGVLLQGVGDEQQALFESKGAGVGNAFNDEMAGVLDRGQLPRIFAIRGSVERCGGFPAERLVGALLVVYPSEAVESSLLGWQVDPWRSGSLCLERPVHALVGTVLLRLAGKDTLMLDAQAEPPDVELGETVNAAGGEGNAVVGADGAGQAVFAEQSLKYRAGALPLGGKQTMTSQKAAGVEIGDGQRVAVDPIAGSEVALEVGGPKVVGLSGRGGNYPGVLVPASAATLLHHSAAGQQVPGRADRRPGHAGMSWPKPIEQLFGSPARMERAGVTDQSSDLLRDVVGTVVGPSTAVRQSGAATVLESAQPFVPGLPADTVTFAQLLRRVKTQTVVLDESFALLHG